MKPIRFTVHALEKLELMREWGFVIDEEMVIEFLKHPQDIIHGYSGRFIAQSMLDENHVLRVVYEEGEEILVVTLYPGRRQRYAH